MASLSDDKEAEIIQMIKSTCRYLDDILHIDNPYFEGMVGGIYSPELQLISNMDLHSFISYEFV